MPRLRTVSCSQPGWTRRRAGKGFVYLDQHGDRISDPELLRRIRELVIPPAWTDVWICPATNGHLQAVGTDDAGRRQYLYHPQWREKRDRMKFDRVLQAAQHLPRGRRHVRRDLAREGMPLQRADAVAVRLLDLGAFRIGNDVYADENESYGLTTLLREHVSRRNGAMVFQFPGKSGKEHLVEIDDASVVEPLEIMRRRRGGSDRLLAYRDGRRWYDLDSTAVNGYLAEVFDDLTAKDFRTWHATVLAAAALADTGPKEAKTARKRAVRVAMGEVADYLGNTPAIARASYVDPRVLDLYEGGVTIDPEIARRHRSPDRRQEALERAVLDLLSG